MPVYTRFLSEADYGILEILDYTRQIFMLIALSGLHIAIPKFFSEESPPSHKKIVVSTGTIYILIVGGLACLLGLFLNDGIADFILGNTEYANLVDLMLFVLFFELISMVVTSGFMAAKRSKVNVGYGLLRLSLGITANLYFIVQLELGVLGMLYGSLLSNGLIAIVIVIHSSILNGIRIEFPIMKQMLLFGAPLIGAELIGAVLHNADRFLIRHYGLLSDVGIYSLGYKFPWMLNTVILQSFSFIWLGATLYEIANRPDGAYEYTRVTTYFMGIYIFAMFSLSVLSRSIVIVLADEKFFVAHEIIPLVAFGLCFHGISTFFTGAAYIKNKTWLICMIHVPAALVNIVGNVFLLPRYGYIAAAWMTIVTYMVFAATSYFSFRRVLNIQYEFKRLSVLFFGALAFFMLSSFFSFQSVYLEIFKGLFFILLFGLFLLFCGWLTQGEREALRNKYLEIKKVLSSAHSS